MPSARSASWPNQGLSGTARHFPGLGILAKMPNSAFSPCICGPSASSEPSRSQAYRSAHDRPGDLLGSR